jgi:CubicO group peptidase (beta-lactamase class C family)
MYALRLLLLASMTLFTMPNIRAASPADSGLSSRLQAIVSDSVRPLSSLSALVIRDGQIIFESHHGQRVLSLDSAGTGEPADHATLYRMASISKLVVAIGALRLVDAGQLDLDADIGKYLGYAVRNPHFVHVPITTRMLLTHTSSLRDDGGYFFPLDEPLKDILQPKAGATTPGATWAAADARSDRTPGRYFTYCNLNFGVLGTVIEAITRKRFDLYMQQEVLQPMGIPGGFTPETLTPTDIAHVAVLYRKGSNDVWNPKGPWVPQVDDYQGKTPSPRAGLDTYVPGTNATGFGPQGGLRTSVAGLGRVMQMLMNQGTVNGVRILSPQAVAAMLQPQWTKNPDQDNGDTLNDSLYAWGLGMQRFEDRSGPSTGDRFLERGGLTGVGHMGFAYGLESGFIFDPLTRNGVVYAIGGVSANPDQNRGRYSAYSIWQERTLDALWNHTDARLRAGD